MGRGDGDPCRRCPAQPDVRIADRSASGRRAGASDPLDGAGGGGARHGAGAGAGHRRRNRRPAVDAGPDHRAAGQQDRRADRLVGRGRRADGGRRSRADACLCRRAGAGVPDHRRHPRRGGRPRQGRQAAAEGRGRRQGDLRVAAGPGRCARAGRRTGRRGRSGSDALRRQGRNLAGCRAPSTLLRRLHPLHDQPEPPRHPPPHGRLRPAHPREQAPRRRPRRRWRLRQQDLPLRRGSPRHLGRRQAQAPRQVDLRPQRSLHVRRARPRPRQHRRDGPRQRRHLPRPPRPHPLQHGRLPQHLRPRRPPPTSTPSSSPAATAPRSSTPRSRPSSPIPSPSTPTAAPAAPRPPSSSNASWTSSPTTPASTA